ncbi:hypothetical protein GUITHDRAFT_103420 [Guillardia theta CCMP2712]|uniref:Uncharacterized protein n=1 Tax=Guillardia theta (strain CCMP2712) TaxID=905079 RepID=L1JRN9_GUITC|nr:hypothetical protein GUITHDRAFT_103420 [Guillardia theta CCMP2712]EKX50830.1 hypothetical protein GUITHDRAFT_103420 [Guillardia theta CCMP2712]|eukprot:XP_005837810.1 hypothetical protein GUITHDRAFT_103420 [Guillardia theta CCMP2712]
MKSESEDYKDDVSLPLRLAWKGAEALGNLAAFVQGRGGNEDLLQRLQLEYEKNYFLSGDIDVSLYHPDCLFADPFASFRGRERFRRNLSNLGLFVLSYRCRLLSLAQDPVDPNVFRSCVMVKLQLNLPWRPVLAWPWRV